MFFSALNLRNHSLLRGTVVVLGSLLLAFVLGGFPNDRPSLKLLFPAFAALLGAWDTMRCFQSHWSFYHGAVMVLIFADMLAIFMILFLLFFPYSHWFI